MPATCGHSPLRDAWAKLVLLPLGHFRPPPLNIHTPLIPVLYGQAEVRRIPERFPHIDAWAVPVHKAMDLRGEFRSSDMKDYLGLGRGQKLILSTAGPDDFMEVLWQRGAELDYRKHGFDYWFPGHFSVYDRDSKFYQSFNARRQQISARRMNSAFVWFRLGEHIPLSWLGPIQECPSILISCQQMFSGFNRDLLRREITLADHVFPKATAFFLLGSGYGAVIRPERRVHEIRSGWIICGLKGYDLHHQQRRQLSRWQLLCMNLTEVYDFVSHTRLHPSNPSRRTHR